MNRSGTILLMLVSLGLGAGASYLALQSRPDQAGKVASRGTTPPERSDHIGAFARLRPANGVHILSGPATDYAFRIARIAVQEGEMVHAGRVLVELDVRTERQARLALSAAETAEAEIAVKYADRDLDRDQKLYAGNAHAISAKQLDDAREADATARARLETARRQQALAQIQLDQATISSPINGMVLKILKREGEGISAGSGVIEVGDVNHMEAVAEVFETGIARIRPGQPAVFSSPALAAPARGKVRRIMPRVQRTTLYSSNAAENTEARVVDVVIALDNDPALRTLTDLQGTVRIDVSAPDS